MAPEKIEPGKEPARVSAGALKAYIGRAFTAVGIPPGDATVLADLITEADLRGSDTHGVFRMPQYCKRIKAGGVNPRPALRVIEERPSTALVDGDNGMGHLAMKLAAETAIAKARQTGIGWVGARMSNHAGPAALYAMMPLAHDMIGLISRSAATITCRPGAGSSRCSAPTRSRSRCRPWTSRRW